MVRLAHYWAGDNDRGAKLRPTNPLLALLEFDDTGKLLPLWKFAGYLPRDCQVRFRVGWGPQPNGGYRHLRGSWCCPGGHAAVSLATRVQLRSSLPHITPLQNDPPQPKDDPASIAPALNATNYYVRPFRGLPTLVRAVGYAARAASCGDRVSAATAAVLLLVHCRCRLHLRSARCSGHRS